MISYAISLIMLIGLLAKNAILIVSSLLSVVVQVWRLSMQQS